MHVEIWSDIACPWCYVGKRRFEAALAGFEHRDDVHGHLAQLRARPGRAAPSAHGDGAEHLAEKYGSSVEQARAMQRPDDRASPRGEGLDFRFDRARGGNTFDAHRLVHLAAAHGAQDAMKERLMRAYLTEGELMSDRADARAPRAPRSACPPTRSRDAARRRPLRRRGARRRAHRARRSASARVPFFVVDRAFGASGAQPPEVLARAAAARLGGAAARSRSSPTGESCGVDGC